MFYNYKLTWNDNHYVYVGFTYRPKKRLQEHKTSCLSKNPKNKKLASVWLKYGEPVMTIMGTFETKEEAVENEQFLIDQIWGEPICLNLNPIAEKPFVLFGKSCSQETRTKLSFANRGKKRTKEQIAKISASQKGKVVSVETRAKMSASQKGKKRGPCSPETKAKISASKKNKDNFSVSNEDAFYYDGQT